MPERLRLRAGRPGKEWWSDGPIPEWVDSHDPEQVSAWRLIEARRAIRDARAEYMRTLNVKPHGVGDLEWCAARGMKYVDWKDR